MKAAALACLLSLLAFSASAQTPSHPCDATPAANPVLVKDAIIVGLCWKPQDNAGVVVPLTSMKITVDGAVVLTWTGPGLTPTSPTANAGGFLYYEAPSIPVPRGSHVVGASAVTADGASAISATFPFSTKGPGPSIVIGVRVR